MTEYILEISFPSSPALEELVEARLFLTSFLGSVSSESSGTTVTAFFDSAAAREAAVALFSNLPVELRQADRAPVDWLEHYQQSLHAMEIGERFVVAPDASLLPGGTSWIGIVVPQEQAFGTGSHESTALCMTLLETLDLRGRRGLDIGSGSGILAIAALRLGAGKVIAFDVDPDTCAALRDNRARNGIPPERMPLFIGETEALRAGTFDFVLMNILPDVIVELLPDVVPRMADEARMVVSGILLAMHDEVVAAARRHGLAVVGDRSRGEWWAGALQRVR